MQSKIFWPAFAHQLSVFDDSGVAPALVSRRQRESLQTAPKGCLMVDSLVDSPRLFDPHPAAAPKSR